MTKSEIEQVFSDSVKNTDIDLWESGTKCTQCMGGNCDYRAGSEGGYILETEIDLWYLESTGFYVNIEFTDLVQASTEKIYRDAAAKLYRSHKRDFDIAGISQSDIIKDARVLESIEDGDYLMDFDEICQELACGECFTIRLGAFYYPKGSDIWFTGVRNKPVSYTGEDTVYVFLIAETHGSYLGESRVNLFEGYESFDTIHDLKNKLGGLLLKAEMILEDHSDIKIAAARGHLDVIKFLLSSGVDVDSQKGSAIKSAVYNRHLGIVRFLVSVGADYSESGLHKLLGVDSLPEDTGLVLSALDIALVNRE